MRSASVAALGLLLLGPAPGLAAPHDGRRFPHDVPAPPASHAQPLRPWRRLSDAIIRRIWNLPDNAPRGGYGAPMAGPAPKDQLVARYRDDVVLRFTIRTKEEAEALAEAVDILFLDVWEFNDDWADIRISKDVVTSLFNLLPITLQHSHKPLMQDLDLARAIFDTLPSSFVTQTHDTTHYTPNLTPASHRSKGHPFFQDYQPLSVINPWINLVSSMFSTHVRRIVIGTSYEGRDIPALRIGVHPTNDDEPTAPRRTILVTGGSHAREWISTSSVTYLAWSLINSYGKSQDITRLLEAFDFVLIPTLNPDGYVYSWETDRLWRKNRQPTSLRFCRGIDLDRSYGFRWDGTSTGSNPCSESFPGDAPFEGVEAQRFADWARNETENNNVEFIAFLDLHSYSQHILYPYSFSCAEEPPALEDLEELALGLAKAMHSSRKGHAYKVTSACEGNVAPASTSASSKNRRVLPRLESATGSALDFFHHDLRVKYAFQIKLRDTGSYGFLLPRENIVPTGEEVVDAVAWLGRFVLGEVGWSESSKGTTSTKGSGVTKDREDVERETRQNFQEPQEEEVLEL